MFCDHCGTAIDPGAKFCEGYGASLGGATLGQATGLARGLWSKGWLWLLAGGGALLLMIVGGTFLVFRGGMLGEKGGFSRREAAQKLQTYSGQYFGHFLSERD